MRLVLIRVALDLIFLKSAGFGIASPAVLCIRQLSSKLLKQHVDHLS